MKFSIALFKPFHKLGWQFRIGEITAKHEYVPIKISIEKHAPISDGQIIPEEYMLDIHEFDLLPLVDAFMEALERAGLRQNTQATIAELKAVKYHLEDMRRLVLK